jgi:hypothetical protein
MNNFKPQPSHSTNVTKKYGQGLPCPHTATVPNVPTDPHHVIVRSAATRQSMTCMRLDCFTPFAMTNSESAPTTPHLRHCEERSDAAIQAHTDCLIASPANTLYGQDTPCPNVPTVLTVPTDTHPVATKSSTTSEEYASSHVCSPGP